MIKFIFNFSFAAWKQLRISKGDLKNKDRINGRNRRVVLGVKNDW